MCPRNLRGGLASNVPHAVILQSFYCVFTTNRLDRASYCSSCFFFYSAKLNISKRLSAHS